MQTKSEIINNILIDYEILRKKREKEEREYRKNIYQRFPELEEIDEKIKIENINMCRNIIHGKKSNNLKNIKKLLDTKKEIYKKNNLKDPEDLVTYSCNLCKDEGIIEDRAGRVKYCSCFKNKFIVKAFDNFNLSENFKGVSIKSFDEDIFDNKIRYDNGLTQRQNILAIKCRIENYVENFDKIEKSLLFFGNTGTGKTYMSVILAKEIIKKGYQALYVGANDLFDRLSRYYFNKDEDSNEEKIFVDFVYDTDFLVIDDLGTEIINSFVKSRLGDIVNTRIVKGKKTLISTNLTADKLNEVYDRRIYSRLEENYEFYEFIGEDLRQR